MPARNNGKLIASLTRSVEYPSARRSELCLPAKREAKRLPYMNCKNHRLKLSYSEKIRILFKKLHIR